MFRKTLNPVHNSCTFKVMSMKRSHTFLVGLAAIIISVVLLLCVRYRSHMGVSQTESNKLSDVKVGVVYENVRDRLQYYIGRDLDDVIEIFEDLGVDFVFRGFWRWSPCPQDCSQLKGVARELCMESGYSYSQLQESISEIKREIPDVIFCGSIPAQKLDRRVWNPVTGEIIDYPETWGMALDPSKWGLPMSKEEFQCRFAQTHFWFSPEKDCGEYEPSTAPAYFPDITNEKFQELIVAWAKKQIDCGADAIWIDMLFTQVRMLAKISGNPNHVAVRESYEAACRVVNEIHQYGASKGKYIYVGSWAGIVVWTSLLELQYEPPPLDFVTFTPSISEVLSLQLDEQKWDLWISTVRDKMGDIPIFVFVDWASTIKTPLGAFSQNLTQEQQCQFIEMADRFFSERGVVFLYPLHGGYMGRDAVKLSFGVSKVYDSLAPEFQTYNTILKLANEKGSVRKHTMSEYLASNKDAESPGKEFLMQDILTIFYPIQSILKAVTHK